MKEGGGPVPMIGRRVSDDFVSWITRHKTGRDIALKISGIYLGIGVSWCFLNHEVRDPEFTKDLVVYTLTAALLFWMIRHGVDAIKKTESALRESEERLARIAETNASGTVVVDPDGRITFLNLAGAGMLGVRRSEVVGQYYRQFLSWVTAGDGSPVAGEELPFARILQTGEPVHNLEIAVRPPGKSRMILSVNAGPFLDPDRKVVGMVASFTDVTERKLAQDLNLRKLSLAMVQSPVGIAISDASGRIEYVNPKLCAMTGSASEEARGRELASLAEHSTADAAGRIRIAVTDGKGWAGQFAGRRRSGEPYSVSASVTPIRDADGALAGFLCLMEDITPRIRLEEEARRVQAQLIHANRMAALGTVVSGVAHEINNPNNLVMFNAPILEAAWKDVEPALEEYCREHGELSVCGIPFPEMREAIPRLLHGISDGALRIKTIVENLKDFTRNGKSPGVSCVVHVNDVVRKAVGIVNHEILKGTRDFRVEYGKDIPPVTGCAQELEQVVINLVNNALQALPGPSAGIRIATFFEPERECVSIAVRDEGRGMTKEVLDRLAEPFFTTRQDAGGLGLGLSICQSILKEHGGALRFESEPGRGTTATIRLPALGAPAGEQAGAPMAAHS
jgi:PAS domain S-box-containing protein